MSLANLNVWVTALDDPCKISRRTWYINIYNCDGSILKWCDFDYALIPARCGHRSIRVPPGCYRINAVWSFRLGNGFYYVNHFTDSAVVQACCGEHQCVTLFNPSAHRCGRIFLAAVHDAVRQDALPKDAATAAEEGIRKVLDFIPRPVRPFELDMLEGLEERVRELDEGKGADEAGRGVFPPEEG